jgi:alanine racemase
VSVIEVNLTALDHNMQALRRMVGPACGLCPIVKADAYGLGGPRVGKRLAFAGAQMLAVYTPEQAAELLNAAIGCPILVLMPVREIARVDEIYRGLTSDKVHLTVHDAGHVADLIAITERYGMSIKVHLEIDTGMSRGGCGVHEAPAVLERIAACRRLTIAGVFTHFANAEADIEFTNRQLKIFERFLSEHGHRLGPECHIHAANSFATLRHARFHKSMVRIGLAWAGYGAEWMAGDELLKGAADLRPIVAWRSRVVQSKHIETGTPVGYGSRWSAKRPTTLGLVPVGYADGYPMNLGARDDAPRGAVVAVFERARAGDGHEHGGLIGYAPVVGAVNMDQISIDLTDLIARRGGADDIGVGTIVELITPDAKAPNHLPNLARLAGTIPHEILTRMSARIRRQYIAPVTAADHVPAATRSAKPAHNALV